MSDEGQPGPGASRVVAILNRPDTARSVLAATRLLAERLPGAVVQVIHPRPGVDPDFLPTEEIMTADRSRAFGAERDGIYRALECAAAQAGFDRPRQLIGQVREVVAHAARGAAAVVAGATGATTGEPGHAEARDTIKAVLFDAEASLLLVPDAVPAVLGRKVALAWERSGAADEALQAALPLLLGADMVTILAARERHARTDPPDGLLAMLRQHGTDVSVRDFGLDGRDIGDAILAEARAAGADLLVMGAFTHPRTLEALFGGATREVMAGARIPVLLHH